MVATQTVWVLCRPSGRHADPLIRPGLACKTSTPQVWQLCRCRHSSSSSNSSSRADLADNAAGKEAGGGGQGPARQAPHCLACLQNLEPGLVPGLAQVLPRNCQVLPGPAAPLPAGPCLSLGCKGRGDLQAGKLRGLGARLGAEAALSSCLPWMLGYEAG